MAIETRQPRTGTDVLDAPGGRIGAAAGGPRMVVGPERFMEVGSRAVPFAVNLVNPSHMEWTHDGKLLVCEHTAGRIVDITSGGDMVDAVPFASGLRGPAAILPQADRILVSESWAGRVAELPLDGGDATIASTYADGLAAPYGLSQDASGRVFVSEKADRFRTQITEITHSDGKVDLKPFVTNIPIQAAPPGRGPLDSYSDGTWEVLSAGACSATWPDFSGPYRAFAVGYLGLICRARSEGGDLLEMIATHPDETLVAWGLQRTAGMKFNPADGRFYVIQPDSGSVLVVDAEVPANYALTPPVVRGLNQPSCVRFSPDGTEMFVCASGDGVVWRIRL